MPPASGAGPGLLRIEKSAIMDNQIECEVRDDGGRVVPARDSPSRLSSFQFYWPIRYATVVRGIVRYRSRDLDAYYLYYAKFPRARNKSEQILFDAKNKKVSGSISDERYFFFVSRGLIARQDSRTGSRRPSRFSSCGATRE